MFAHAYESAYYFKLTLVRLFHGCFADVLPSIEYRFNSLLGFNSLFSFYSLITGVCS